MYRTIITLLLLSTLLLPACKKNAPTARSSVGEIEDNFEKLVKKNVEDETKQDRLLLLLEENRQTFSAIKIGFLDMTDKLRANPEITREEAEAIVAEFTALRNNALNEMAARRIEMRQFATEKEWNAIHAALDEKSAMAKKKQEKSEGGSS
jgi:hypothetical protein